jgi:hypothetical protein
MKRFDFNPAVLTSALDLAIDCSVADLAIVEQAISRRKAALQCGDKVAATVWLTEAISGLKQCRSYVDSAGRFAERLSNHSCLRRSGRSD